MAATGIGSGGDGGSEAGHGSWPPGTQNRGHSVTAMTSQGCDRSAERGSVGCLSPIQAAGNLADRSARLERHPNAMLCLFN